MTHLATEPVFAVFFSDAVWNTLITTVGGVFMAYIALRTEMIRSSQGKMKGQIAEAATTAAEVKEALHVTAEEVKEAVSVAAIENSENLASLSNQMTDVAHKTNGIHEAMIAETAKASFAEGVKSETDKDKLKTELKTEPKSDPKSK